VHAESESDIGNYIDALPQESKQAAAELAQQLSQGQRASVTLSTDPVNKRKGSSPREKGKEVGEGAAGVQWSGEGVDTGSLKWKKRDEMSILQALIESDMGPIPNGPPPRKGHKKQDKTFKRKKTTTKKKGGGGGGAEDESNDDDQRATKVLVYHLIMEAQKKREQEESKKKQEEEEEKARRRKQEHEDGFSEDEEDNAAEAEEAALSLEERYNRLKLRYDKQLRNRRAAEAELQAFETLLVAGGKAGFEETLAFWREAKRMPPEERLRVLKEKTTDATPPPSWAPAHTPRRTRRQLGAELIRTESVMYDAVPEAAREPSRPSLMFAKKVAVSFSRDLNAFLSANPGEITSSKAQAFLDSFKIHDIDLMKGGIIGGEEDDDDEDEEGVEEELMLEEGGYNHYEDLHFSDAEEVKKHQSGEMGKGENKSVRKSVQKESDAEEDEEDEEEEDDEDDDDDDGAIGELDESGRPIQRLPQTQQAIGQSRTIRTTASTTRTSTTPEGVSASGIQTQQPPLRKMSTNIQPEEIQRLQKVVAKKQAHLDKLRAYLAATKGEEGEGHTNGHDARLQDLLTSERRGTNELFKMMKDGASLLPPDGDHEAKDQDGAKHLSTGNPRRSAFYPAGKTKRVIDDHNKNLLSGSTGLFSSLSEGSRSMLREVSPTHEKEGEASADVDVVADKEKGEKKVVEKKQHRRGNSIIRVKKPKEEQDGSSGHPATPTSPKKGGTFIHRRQASNK